MIMAMAGCALLTGCYKDVRMADSSSSDGSSGGSDGGAVPADSVTFAKYVVPLFTSNCVTCHGGNEAPDLRADNAYKSLINGKYVVAGDAASSILYQKVSSGSMPPDGPMKTTDIDKIKNWINNGALNN
ncbi:hypothetical protein FLA_1849 [Filimonas lacunae]|nr:hypothetical protein FLA_1849 [Filimonas lacunae]